MSDSMPHQILDYQIGGAINAASGQYQSARQQYRYNQALQQNAQDFAKWQMANSHQMEVADLEAAGLNPVLSANSGASAGVAGTSTGPGLASIDPISAIGSIVNMTNSAKQTNANVKLANAEITKKLKEAGLTQKQIDFFIKYGVPPGTTITKSGSVNAGWGAMGTSNSTTTPVGLKNTNGNSAINVEKAFRNMDAKKWINMSDAQKSMFPKELRELYNRTYY